MNIKETEEKEIITELERVDWNFPGSLPCKNSVHSLHLFPGNFISQIPSYLIQILSKEGNIVCDPFCGSGTTGIEALLLKRNFIQSDLNLAGLQVAKGKLLAITNKKVSKKLRCFINDSLWNSFYLKADKKGKNHEGKHPDLVRWFHELTYTQLLYIWQIIKQEENATVRDVLILIFSDTLFACASTSRAQTKTGGIRKHHWGWVADNVIPRNPFPHKAIDIFHEKINNAVNIIELNSNKKISNSGLTLRGDSKHLSLLNSSVDLIVTSPPYIGMIDYTLANRLHYLWMGWNIKEEKTREIGARYRRQRKNGITEYLSSMEEVAQEIKRVLKHGKYCAIIIGASRKYPQVATDVIDLFGKYFKQIWGPISRKPSRRRISERKGSEVIEYLCVYRKIT